MRKVNVILKLDRILEPGNYTCQTEYLDVSEYPPILGVTITIKARILDDSEENTKLKETK